MDPGLTSPWIDDISHTTIKAILKKNELKPHLCLQWCLGQITAEFLARIEQVLQLYHQAYDGAYPVVCFDERPCQLLDQVSEPVPMQPSKPRKEDNDGAARRYERKRTC